MGIDERARLLSALRDPDPARRYFAAERLGTLGLDGPDVRRALLDAAEDVATFAQVERVWDDPDDVRATETVSRRVADAAVKVLRSPHRRADAVADITAALATRAPAAQTRLFEVLGELAPDSTGFLVASLSHADDGVRGAAARALEHAIHFSEPARQIEILVRAVEGLTDPTLGPHWERLLAHKASALASPSPRLRAPVIGHGPDVDKLVRWLDSEVAAVRDLGLTMLACHPSDARARELLTEWITVGARRAVTEVAPRDGNGFRCCPAFEYAMAVLCADSAEVLAAMRRDVPALDAALREYAVHGLREPGEPWFMVVVAARHLTNAPEVTETILAGLESPNAEPVLAALLVVHARAATEARGELVRRGVLALLASHNEHARGHAVTELAAIDGAVFTATVLPLLEGAGPFDAVTWQIADGLAKAGCDGLPALPALEALAARTTGWSPVKRAIKALRALSE